MGNGAAEEAERRGRSRIITYTLEEEIGFSLRYARWQRDDHVSKGGSWNTPSRPRIDKSPTMLKVRWYPDLHPLEPLKEPAPPKPAQGNFWQQLVGGGAGRTRSH
ncbi:XF1762 family protein [Teichococcus aerofrigidensis]